VINLGLLAIQMKNDQILTYVKNQMKDSKVIKELLEYTSTKLQKSGKEQAMSTQNLTKCMKQ
jgi:hypothetical protein